MPVVPLTKLFFIVDYMEIIYSLCSCNTMIFIAGYSIYQFVHRCGKKEAEILLSESSVS